MAERSRRLPSLQRRQGGHSAHNGRPGTLAGIENLTLAAVTVILACLAIVVTAIPIQTTRMGLGRQAGDNKNSGEKQSDQTHRITIMMSKQTSKLL